MRVKLSCLGYTLEGTSPKIGWKKRLGMVSAFLSKNLNILKIILEIGQPFYWLKERKDIFQWNLRQAITSNYTRKLVKGLFYMKFKTSKYVKLHKKISQSLRSGRHYYLFQGDQSSRIFCQKSWVGIVCFSMSVFLDVMTPRGPFCDHAIFRSSISKL